ncbi:hypothetical protein [Winogradskyella aurantia]|uniref:Uncharacterized protein n=1 Tax=Winogradskyella aurantia TaxID=1915063 RepID=A0A265UMB2_9FLAO|nr:hypothetical protein [Winogradskyella aurantia]OZV66399.1 hypothetical protein CA834_14440 [Winogradskyella aurantia]
MNKIIFIIILSLGFSNFSFSQQKVLDSVKYIPTEFVKTLLKENDSLKITFDKTKEKLTKEQIEGIFSKTKNKEYDIKKTRIALELTSLLGDNWNFDETLKPENTLNFKTIEELEKFNNSLPTSESVSFENDGSLKRKETTFKNGSKEIIEKDRNGNFIKKTIDENGNETIDKIKDISEIKIKKPKVEIIKE